MSKRTLRGKVAIAGVGETPYYKHGKAPVSEFKLALQAILAACEDAGIDPRRIDGFASYSNDRNEPSRLAAALGIPAMRFSNMNWGGGGGGGSAAVGNAATGGRAAWPNASSSSAPWRRGQFQRFRRRAAGRRRGRRGGLNAPYGVMSPAQRYAMRAMRFLHENHIAPSAQRAIAVRLLSSRAEQPARGDAWPAAHRRGLRCVALDRRAVAPVRLLPENDGAAALDHRAGRDGARSSPQAALSAGSAQGSEYRNGARGHNARRSTPPELHHGGAAAYDMAG